MKQVFAVRLSIEANDDLEHLFDHLHESYLAFGDPPKRAFDRAAARIEAALDKVSDLGAAPYQGTLWSEVLPSLRWVTKDQVVIYFTIDDEGACVSVLAVFFGGQDHKRHMLDRILGRNNP